MALPSEPCTWSLSLGRHGLCGGCREDKAGRPVLCTPCNTWTGPHPRVQSTAHPSSWFYFAMLPFPAAAPEACVSPADRGMGDSSPDTRHNTTLRIAHTLLSHLQQAPFRITDTSEIGYVFLRICPRYSALPYTWADYGPRFHRSIPPCGKWGKPTTKHCLLRVETEDPECWVSRRSCLVDYYRQHRCLFRLKSKVCQLPDNLLPLIHYHHRYCCYHRHRPHQLTRLRVLPPGWEAGVVRQAVADELHS